MAEGEKPTKKKSFLSKAGSVTVSAIGLILMSGSGQLADADGFTPNLFGTSGGARMKKREGIPALDQMCGDACRALYVPKHNSNVRGVLPVYDFTQDYHDKLRDENIGSDKWKYTLGLMRRPQGEGRDGTEVSYWAEMEENNRAFDKQIINVRKRSLVGNQATTTLSIPLNDLDAAFTFTAASPADVRTVTKSHHVAPITTSESGEAHPAPWFTIASSESSKSYQWQIHPIKHGPLQYILIEFPSSAQNASAIEPENQHRIRAIYHNVGVGTSLVQPFSEGVLLLPANNKDMDANFEMVVVTSLIGLLWKAREVQTVKMELPASKDIIKPKSKAGGGFFRKSWNDGKEDEVIR